MLLSACATVCYFVLLSASLSMLLTCYFVVWVNGYVTVCVTVLLGVSVHVWVTVHVTAPSVNQSHYYPTNAQYITCRHN